MKQHAQAAFRRPPERLNCAQSVLHAYREVSGDRAVPLDTLKPFGGGRAPNGLCGALHAACFLAPEHAEDIKTQFAERLGSLFCREIRSSKTHPCEVCVGHASALLEASRNKRP